jgi:hypothetical protein
MDRLVRAPAPVARLGDRPGEGCRSFLRRTGRHGVLRQRAGRGQSKRATAPCLLGAKIKCFVQQPSTATSAIEGSVKRPRQATCPEMPHPTALP